MVEQTLSLNSIFGALSDPTRRDILERLLTAPLSIGQIADRYDVSLAAISKQIKVLESAKLVVKRRQGKQYLVSATPQTLRNANDYIAQYRRAWENRLDALELYLQSTTEESHE